MIINQLKRIITLIYFIIYTIYCSKATRLPFIKDKYSLFYNEFLNLIPIFYKNICDSSIYQTGKLITTNKIDIVISNHINRIDSFIITSIIKSKTTKTLYPVIQKEMAKLPILNSFAPGCIVINRDFESDINTIKKFIKNVNNGIIIILPEGTRMNNDNLKKSQEFSENNKLKKYNNLLYPKMQGLNLIINELNNDNKLGNLIDITMKVKDKLKCKTGYLDFIKYKVGNLYCNVDTYKINNKCLNNYDNLKKWILMIWDKKENYLDNYIDYEYKKINYFMKTSTFILNIFILSMFLQNFKLLNIFSLTNKNNIIIK